MPLGLHGKKLSTVKLCAAIWLITKHNFKGLIRAGYSYAKLFLFYHTVSGHMFFRFCVKLNLFMSITYIFTV